MEKSTTIEPARVSFLNRPKPLKENASEHEQKKEKLRQELIPYIEEWVQSSERFAGREVAISIFHTGVSSLVCLLNMSDEKLVLKIPLNDKVSEGEVDCLKSWEAVGVNVPRVVEEGKINNRSYILMVFVDAKRLIECSAEELVGKEISFRMGQTLRQMHESKAEGYGRIRDHKASYAEFKEWLKDDDVEKRIEYVKKEKILNDKEHGSIAEALDVLNEHVVAHPVSTYCHHDYGRGNAFNTDPITIFDPDPMINHPIIDISRSIVLTAGSMSEPGETVAKLLAGYFGDEEYDSRVLKAGILLNAHTKLYFWHRSGQVERIARLKNYLKKLRSSS